MALNFLCPSLTALHTAVLSAHTVNPYVTFSTLQPGGYIRKYKGYFYVRLSRTAISSSTAQWLGHRLVAVVS